MQLTADICHQKVFPGAGMVCGETRGDILDTRLRWCITAKSFCVHACQRGCNECATKPAYTLFASAMHHKKRFQAEMLVDVLLPRGSTEDRSPISLPFTPQKRGWFGSRLRDSRWKRVTATRRAFAPQEPRVDLGMAAVTSRPRVFRPTSSKGTPSSVNAFTPSGSTQSRPPVARTAMHVSG